MAEGRTPGLSLVNSVAGVVVQGGTIKNTYIQSNVRGNPNLGSGQSAVRANPGEIRSSVVGAVFSDVVIDNVHLQSNINRNPPSRQEMYEDLSWDVVTPNSQGLYCFEKSRSSGYSGLHSVADDLGEIYKMNSHPYRGAAFILNNSFFPNMEQKERKGSEVDVENAKRLWKSYGFYVKTANNKSAEEIMEELSDFLALDKVTQTDCVVVMLMSHGGEGELHGNDSIPISYSDVFALFKPDVCPKLKDKPKIFFIQACRGENIEVGVDANPVEDEHEMGDAGAAQPNPFENCLRTPLPADFYIAYSTCDGFYSMRDNIAGSYFIQALVEVFIALADKEDLKSLMTKVSGKVSRMVGRVTIAKRSVRMLQQPQEHSTLNKKVYFKVKE
ncbi:caspase-3-like [Anneissia japonica]|uniref:caspase-3-like n=1 Tax=Anneissia japonica TaxID=1529436 RepID=UPI00142566B6|nr:caspase-3-like [Anneissia japonica]